MDKEYLKNFTKEELNEWELLNLRLGYLMVSKIVKGKIYYQVSLD